MIIPYNDHPWVVTFRRIMSRQNVSVSVLAERSGVSREILQDVVAGHLLPLGVDRKRVDLGSIYRALPELRAHSALLCSRPGEPRATLADAIARKVDQRAPVRLVPPLSPTPKQDAPEGQLDLGPLATTASDDAAPPPPPEASTPPSAPSAPPLPSAPKRPRRPRPSRRRWAHALKAARLAAGLQRREVGKKVGVHASSVLRWESGRGWPVGEHVRRLADLFPALAEEPSRARERPKPVGWVRPAAANDAAQPVAAVAPSVEPEVEVEVAPDPVEPEVDEVRKAARKAFGARLRAARRASNLHADELAEMLGVTGNGLRNWESGHRPPRPDLLAQLVALFPSLADAAPPASPTDATPDEPEVPMPPPAAAKPIDVRPESDATVLIGFGRSLERLTRTWTSVQFERHLAVLDGAAASGIDLPRLAAMFRAELDARGARS